MAGDDGAFESFGRISYYGVVNGPDGSDIPVPVSVAYAMFGSGAQFGGRL